MRVDKTIERIFRTEGDDGVYYFTVVRYYTSEGERYKIFAKKFKFDGLVEKWRVGQNFTEKVAYRIVQELIENVGGGRNMREIDITNVKGKELAELVKQFSDKNIQISVLGERVIMQVIE